MTPATLDQAGPALIQRGGAASPIAEGGGIIAGLSAGASVAVQIAERSPGAYRGLILLGANVFLDVKRLREAGIAAVVLASGRLDAARPGMERAALALEKQGLRARYISLGEVGHALSPDMDGFLTEALAWLSAP